MPGTRLNPREQNGQKVLGLGPDFVSLRVNGVFSLTLFNRPWSTLRWFETDLKLSWRVFFLWFLSKKIILCSKDHAHACFFFPIWCNLFFDVRLITELRFPLPRPGILVWAWEQKGIQRRAPWWLLLLPDAVDYHIGLRERLIPEEYDAAGPFFLHWSAICIHFFGSLCVWFFAGGGTDFPLLDLTQSSVAVPAGGGVDSSWSKFG